MLKKIFNRFKRNHQYDEYIFIKILDHEYKLKNTQENIDKIDNIFATAFKQIIELANSQNENTL